MDISRLRLVPQNLQDRFIGMLSALVPLLLKWGLSPNALTVAGAVITSFGALALAMGYIRAAGLIILLGGFCDTIDGLMARKTGQVSRFGALLDSCIDRYSEFAIFIGMAIYFLYQEDYATTAGAALALCGSFMVSYTRARAENLGFESRMGIMQRPERILLIALGAVLHVTIFKVVIWLVALLANVTAFQRIWNAYRQQPANIEKDGAAKPSNEPAAGQDGCLQGMKIEE